MVAPAAKYLPGFGVVVHMGRKTGRSYRTPVNVYRRDGVYVIALTYGPDADWVRNVRIAGTCTLETRGRALRLTRPHVYRSDEHVDAPLSLRALGKLAGVAYFLELAEVDGAAGNGQTGSGP